MLTYRSTKAGYQLKVPRVRFKLFSISAMYHKGFVLLVTFKLYLSTINLFSKEMRPEDTVLRIRICLLPEEANRDNTFRPLAPSAVPRALT